MTARPSAAAPTADVLVVGGGILGMACADELARRGRKVVLFDRKGPGGEASWAAGGMLAVTYEFDAPGPLADFAVRSLGCWSGFGKRLGAMVPFPVEPATGGIVQPVRDEAERRVLESRFAWHRDAGRRIEWLAPADARAKVPSLSPDIAGAFWLRDDAWVNNRAVLLAQAESLRRAAVEVVRGVPAAVWFEGGALRGVIAGDRRWSAPVVINAAGAWASGIAWEPEAGPAVPAIRPVRGQMLGILADDPDALRHVVRWDGGYAVPRGAGRIVVGATSEPEAGFDKSVTAEGRERLQAGVRTHLPGMRFEVTHAWAGLRPESADGLPVLGAHPALPGYLLAAGLYRNGILLAPAAAEAIADLAVGETPRIPIDAFSPARASLGSPATVRVNGKARSVVPGATVGGLLDELGQRRPGIAVAVNDEVVRRGEWDATRLRDHDRIEIIHAVGGG